MVVTYQHCYGGRVSLYVVEVLRYNLDQRGGRERESIITHTPYTLTPGNGLCAMGPSLDTTANGYIHTTQSLTSSSDKPATQK